MTSLCTPFLSNFSTTNVFLLLATSLAGLLTFLNPPQKSSIQEQSIMPACFTPSPRVSRPIKGRCLYNCQDETVASTAIGGSLSQIMSNHSSDFKSQREEAGLVHSLELLDDAYEEGYDVQTVVSCMMSDRDDPNSTENSFDSQGQLSDLEDL